MERGEDMERAIAIITVLIIIGYLFAGCSGSAVNTSSKAVTETNAFMPASKTQAHGKCEITYLTWAQSNDGFYPQSMINAFEAKYPWIIVNFEIGSTFGDTYQQTQKVKFLSHDEIDVTTLLPNTYKDYVSAGYLEELSGAPYLKNYSSSSLGEVTLNGKIYAIPYAKDVEGVMYNKDLFTKNGWQVPTCQEDWLVLCNTIAATGVTPMVNGAKDAWPLAHEVMPFMHELYVNNPDIFDKIKNGDAKYTDNIFVDCFTKIQGYFNSKAVSKDAIGLTYDKAAAYFAVGKAAMICHGEWAMDSIKGGKPHFEIGVFQIPANKKGEEQVGAAEIGQFQAIASCSRNKDAAQKFLDYMSSKEGAQYFADCMGNFTPVQDVKTAEKEQWWDIINAKSVPFYYDQMYFGASTELYKQLQLMYIEDTTVEDALKSIQEAQDKQRK